MSETKLFRLKFPRLVRKMNMSMERGGMILTSKDQQSSEINTKI